MSTSFSVLVDNVRKLAGLPTSYLDTQITASLQDATDEIGAWYNKSFAHDNVQITSDTTTVEDRLISYLAAILSLSELLADEASQAIYYSDGEHMFDKRSIGKQLNDLLTNLTERFENLLERTIHHSAFTVQEFKYRTQSVGRTT